MSENLEDNFKETEEVDYKEQYIRLLADYQNLQKRHAENLELTENRLKFKANSNLIDVYSDAHMATQVQGISSDTVEGIITFMDKIESILETQGIFKMNIDKYDSDNHEVVAILVEGSTKIVSIVKHGWISGNTILSYPQVVLG